MAVPRITSLRFRNVRLFQDTQLPLEQLSVIIGPNSSGKSTALKAIRWAANPAGITYDSIVSFEAKKPRWAEIRVNFEDEHELHFESTWEHNQRRGPVWSRNIGPVAQEAIDAMTSIRIYTINPKWLVQPNPLRRSATLGEEGHNLAALLDHIRDSSPERFEALNKELGRWMPEFDRILFEADDQGSRYFKLRTRVGHHSVPAQDLSQGTVLALAYLTLAYDPKSPSLIAIEEPEHGIHPRLLTEVRDALNRLAFPKDYGETREASQVIVTTHSPYFLDLFRDDLDQVIIAEKRNDATTFRRLSDHPEISGILGGTTLGAAWHTGILGGVPSDQ
jgi:predicted ATPase